MTKVGRSLLALLTLLLLLAACGAPSSVSTPTPRPTLPRSTPSPARPSETATPTRTPQPTNSPWPTRTRTSTAVPVATLTRDEEAALVQRMLETNGGCELPCLWGIVPGKSPYDAVKGFFAGQGMPSVATGLTADSPNPEQLFEYESHLSLSTRDNVVQRITLEGETYNFQLSTRFAQDWLLYSWSQILGQLGPPSEVRVSMAQTICPEKGGCIPAGYGMVLFYDTLGVAVEYVGPAQDTSNGGVRACPRFSQVTNIRIVSVSPEASASLLDAALPPDPLLEKYHHVKVIDFWPLLEDATGMSVEGYYRTFVGPNSRTCLEMLPYGSQP